MSFQFTDRTADCGLEFFQGAVERELPGFGHVGHGNRLQVRQTGFEHAAFVRIAVLGRVLIAQVHGDPRDAIAVPVERIADDVRKPLFDVRTEVNVIVVIHLNLHVVLVFCRAGVMEVVDAGASASG
jgi:hypothetical protein